MTLEMEFHQAMLDGCQRTVAFGYNPSYFRREVANQGGVAAVKALLDKHGVSDGFTRLWMAHRLDLSCEAFVIAPYYAELFTSGEIARARDRLVLFDFDVDAYLARIGEDAP